MQRSCDSHADWRAHEDLPRLLPAAAAAADSREGVLDLRAVGSLEERRLLGACKGPFALLAFEALEVLGSGRLSLNGCDKSRERAQARVSERASRALFQNGGLHHHRAIPPHAPYRQMPPRACLAYTAGPGNLIVSSCTSSAESGLR